MKKVFPLLLFVIAVFSACSISSPPDIGNDFTYNSTVKFNDISYKAEISYRDYTVYFTPVSTNAAGMTISCDGSYVTYSYDNMINTSDMAKVALSNPSVVIYEVITAFHQSDINKNDELYTVKGKISAGNFILTVDNHGKLISLDVPDINLYILFS